MKNICLRLANRLADGSGAQVQRHLEVIAIAQYLNTLVVQGNISDIDTNPGDGINSPKEKKKHVQQINSHVIPRFADCHEEHKVLNSRLINWLILNHLRNSRRLLKMVDQILSLTKIHIAVNIHNTATIIRRNQFILEDLKRRMSRTFTQHENRQTFLKVVAHIHGAKKLSKQMQSRFIDIDWFVDVLNEIKIQMDSLDISFKVEVHTDIPEMPGQIWENQLGLSSETKRIWIEEGLIDENGKMRLAFLDLSGALQGLPNLSIVRNIPPTEVLNAFRTADILITNKSSLSFVGAFLNDRGIIVYTDSWLPRLDSWLYISEQPNTTEIQEFRNNLKTKILARKNL